jgi:hypothetical protein
MGVLHVLQRHAGCEQFGGEGMPQAVGPDLGGGGDAGSAVEAAVARPRESSSPRRQGYPEMAPNGPCGPAVPSTIRRRNFHPSDVSPRQSCNASSAECCFSPADGRRVPHRRPGSAWACPRTLGWGLTVAARTTGQRPAPPTRSTPPSRSATLGVLRGHDRGDHHPVPTIPPVATTRMSGASSGGRLRPLGIIRPAAPQAHPGARCAARFALGVGLPLAVARGGGGHEARIPRTRGPLGASRR